MTADNRTNEPTPNPTAEQAERVSMEVLNEYRKIAAWLEAQAATRGPVGDTMHGLAAEALTNLIEHEYSRHKIPLYGMLDLWMALGVTSRPEFDEFYDEHGYAETWSRLLDGVRRLRRARGLLSEGAPSDEQVERAAKSLFENGLGEGDYTWAELIVEDPSRADIWREDARRALTAAGIAPQGSTAAASALCDEVIADLGDNVRTHGPECYRWHAGCLALRVRQALAHERDLEEAALISRSLSPEALEAKRVAHLAAQPVLDPEKVAEVERAAAARALEEAASAWAADPDAWGDNEKEYRNELRARAAEYRKAVRDGAQESE